MNLGLLIKIFIIIFIPFAVCGQTIEKKYALFKLLNKSTNKVSKKEILVNSTINWETLNIEVLYCASSPPTEIPEDYILLDIYELTATKNINIYKGWMISSSPEITSLEHPIYDLWLVGCINDKTS